MPKHIIAKAALALPVAALAVFGTTSTAFAAGATTTNSGGSGGVNLVSNPVYDAGVTATWSRTDVSNPSWYDITNASITTTDSYGWHQTYTLTEKQKNAGDAITVTGTVALSTPYGSYTGNIASFTLPAGSKIDVPFASGQGGVVTENSSIVGAHLLNAEINVVYNIQPAGVNANYWFGY